MKPVKLTNFALIQMFNNLVKDADATDDEATELVQLVVDHGHAVSSVVTGESIRRAVIRARESIEEEEEQEARDWEASCKQQIDAENNYYENRGWDDQS